MASTSHAPNLRHDRPAITLVAAILTDANRTLLVRRSDPDGPYTGLWDRPLLQVESGGVPEDRLVDGLREQFGIEVEAFSLETVGDDIHEEVFYRRYVYRVGTYSGAIALDSAMRWYTDAEIADVFQLNPLVARRVGS